MNDTGRICNIHPERYSQRFSDVMTIKPKNLQSSLVEVSTSVVCFTRRHIITIDLNLASFLKRSLMSPITVKKLQTC